MKNHQNKNVNRIALISIAAAVLMVCSPLTAFAAEATPAKVIYTGDGSTTTVAVEDAENLNTFANLMPNQSTSPQNITIQNKSSKTMQVYFRAEPSASVSNQAASQKLLDTLILTVTFKMDDKSDVQTLYQGPASGKTSAADLVTAPISLGYVYGNSDSGKLSATLTAPETMGNEFQNINANIKWVFQFYLTDPSHHDNGGGGGGRGNAGGGTAVSAVTVPTESIAPESTPQGGPSVAPIGTEPVPNDDIPLSKPPKTGESPIHLWIVLVVALAACAVFVAVRGKVTPARKDR